MFWSIEGDSAIATMCSWMKNLQTYCMTHWSLAVIWYRCVTWPKVKLIQICSLNNCMPWRVTLILILLTITAHALHTNTFAVFELKEQLQMLYMNMWELLLQLEYVTSDQRVIVYQEIEHIKQQIIDTVNQLKQHDRAEHP